MTTPALIHGKHSERYARLRYLRRQLYIKLHAEIAAMWGELPTYNAHVVDWYQHRLDYYQAQKYLLAGNTE